MYMLFVQLTYFLSKLNSFETLLVSTPDILFAQASMQWK